MTVQDGALCNGPSIQPIGNGQGSNGQVKNSDITTGMLINPVKSSGYYVPVIRVQQYCHWKYRRFTIKSGVMR
jgi:hypothetical protein